jgi:hypothetical protein
MEVGNRRVQCWKRKPLVKGRSIFDGTFLFTLHSTPLFFEDDSECIWLEHGHLWYCIIILVLRSIMVAVPDVKTSLPYFLLSEDFPTTLIFLSHIWASSWTDDCSTDLLEPC